MWKFFNPSKRLAKYSRNFKIFNSYFKEIYWKQCEETLKAFGPNLELPARCKKNLVYVFEIILR